jgi:hypothetical protein
LEQYAPKVTGLTLAGSGRDGFEPGAVRPGQAFRATVAARDPDGDELRIEWRVIEETSDRRSGGDAEAIPATIPNSIASARGKNATITAPTKPGAYRVFVFVRDGTGRAGTANVPFLVVE